MARLSGEVAGHLNKLVECKQGAHQCPRTEQWVIAPACALIAWFHADGGTLAALVLLAASISVNLEKGTE